MEGKKRGRKPTVKFDVTNILKEFRPLLKSLLLYKRHILVCQVTKYISHTS